MNTQPISEDSIVHRIGGNDLENLRLKPHEEALEPPGFSVFLGGTHEDVVEQVREAFPHATRLIQASERMVSTSVGNVRRAGFDVISAPTRRFANHGRLTHPDGSNGFTEANLTVLANVFKDSQGAPTP